MPDVPRAPAPWTLAGQGWVVVLRLPDAVRCDPRHLPEALGGQRPSGPSVVMLVDYASSPAGPYQELLYMPGRFTCATRRRAWSVTRIYVSTWNSVVNGRRNWGIPKDRADFVRSPRRGGERIAISTGGQAVATIELAAAGPALPVHGAMLPASMRRLVQHHGGQRFEFTPGARGRAGLARLVACETNGVLFPDLAAGRVLLALHIPRFTMHFPRADPL